MSIYAISDLHLSFSCDKPMDIFGVTWENHFEQIVEDWKSKISSNDTILLAGDLSWAMTLENAKADIVEIEKLPGKKVIVRGNHDYWWQSYTKLAKMLAEKNIFAIQNNALKLDNVIYCGSRGWAIGDNNKTTEDERILNREILRLEMSLQQAVKLKNNNEPIIALLHFPPFENLRSKTVFTELLEKYEVNKVVYGHLHGKQGRTQIVNEINGIRYYLTSCDKLGNNLIKISD